MSSTSTSHPLQHLRRWSAGLVLLLSLFLMIIVPETSALQPAIIHARTTGTESVLKPSREEINGTYTGDWMVQLTPGTDANASAARLGFQNLGPLGNLPNTYLFRPLKTTRTMNRSYKLLATASEVIEASPDRVFAVTERTVPPITDPLYPQQWHLKNTGQEAGGVAGNDANVYPAWDQGYTGSGVVLASVDDGLWWNSPDLMSNYLASASKDFVDNDFEVRHSDHGTQVGGVMAGVANTSPNATSDCGVGVAFNADLAGIRVLNSLEDLPQVTLARIASGLSYQNAVIAVYNNSWGPLDDGMTIDGPDSTINNVLQTAITNGRGGKGNIFVWAAGNGGSTDNTNADGYVASIYTIGVGGSTASGVRPTYGEPGASILVNAPTDGIRTTKGNGAIDCVTNFNGTSASAAVVSGVVGLMLQANPNLTWRDIQHILVNTAVKNDPTSPGWTTNAAGYHVSHDYGFGRVDAGAATSLAATWQNVPAQTSVFMNGMLPVTTIPDGNLEGVSQPIQVDANFVVEHVVISPSITHTNRGQLEIQLISPSGTISRLMYGRTLDTSSNGFSGTKMMTVHNWGEMSAGTWILKVIDNTPGATGSLNGYIMTIYGFNGTPVKTNTPTYTPSASPTPTDTPTLTATPVLGSFNLLTPADETVMTMPGEITTMTWQTSAAATAYRLDIEPVGLHITYSNTGDPLTCSASVCTLLLDSAGIDLALFGGVNTWSVTAINGLGEIAAANAPFTLTVGIPTNTDEPTATSTPTRTGTPTATGTITPTENPAGTDTPTSSPTMTEAPGELLVNPGFDEDSDEDKVPDGWTGKLLAKDKLKCNKPDKIVAFDGVCMFQFTGGAGENSKLSQSIDLAQAVSLHAGDVLNLEGYVKANGSVNAKVKVTVAYTDTSIKPGKLTVKVTLPSADWVKLADILNMTLAGEPASIKIMIQNKGISGKVRLDAFSLWTSTDSLIGMPGLPGH